MEDDDKGGSREYGASNIRGKERIGLKEDRRETAILGISAPPNWDGVD
jgi:hypothetical protein